MAVNLRVLSLSHSIIECGISKTKIVQLLYYDAKLYSIVLSTVQRLQEQCLWHSHTHTYTEIKT